MMFFKRQICNALLLLNINLLLQQSCAELVTAPVAPISSLYDNLLQREYAGPIVFPNHQVERKAQRSPSLRLRFGRSDPDLASSNSNTLIKRWFGDVNQKPIRSPSLRLRFGRRSDPNLPQMRRTAYDDLLERQLTAKNNNNEQQQLSEDDSLDWVDYDMAYERVARKPQRLRWGRSAPQYESNEQQFAPAQFYNSDKLRHMLMALQQYEDSETSDMDNEINGSDEFQREARKPMRLRWGRSTGKAPVNPKQSSSTGTETVQPAVAKTQN